MLTTLFVDFWLLVADNKSMFRSKIPFPLRSLSLVPHGLMEKATLSKLLKLSSMLPKSSSTLLSSKIAGMLDPGPSLYTLHLRKVY